MKLKTKSNDSKALRRVANKIVDAVMRAGGTISQIPMPTRTKKFSLIRGPHVDKKSRETFFVSVYTMVFYIKINSSVMQEIKNIDIPPEVGIKITMNSK